MSLFSSIHSFLLSPVPRPENRSREQIERDLEDEFSFHLEMKARMLMADDGLAREAASGVARDKFGDVEAVKSQCRRIALKEQVMLQRVNFIMMAVVMVMVILVGVQMLITQRHNTLALQAITTEMTNMKYDALAAQRGASNSTGGSVSPGQVYLNGDVARRGVYQLPQDGVLTLSRMITAAGGVQGDASAARVLIKRPDGDALRTFSYNLNDAGVGDFVLKADDELSVSTGSSRASAGSNDLYALAGDDVAGRWVQVDEGAAVLPNGATLDLVAADDMRNLRGIITGSLMLSQRTEVVLLEFQPVPAARNLRITAPERRPSTHEGRWRYADDRLTINISEALPDFPEPLTFARQATGEKSGDVVKDDARAKAVGDFVLQLFAAADPNDPNLDQTIRNILDETERELDVKYKDDPATAGMIRELIGARRKIFEADGAIQQAANAEAKSQAMMDFLNNMLVNVDPHARKAAAMSEALDNAEQGIDEKFADNPEVAAALRQRIADARAQIADEQKQKSTDATPQVGVPATNKDQGEDDASKVNGPPPAHAAAPADDPANDPGEARQDDDHFPKLSPFWAVRWKDQWTPIVNFNGDWYELKSIDGREARAIVEHCRRKHGDEHARKRFSEDLAQMLIEMGFPPAADDTVKLQVKDMRSGTLLAVNQAKMTNENRERVVAENRAAEGAGEEYPLWEGAE